MREITNNVVELFEILNLIKSGKASEAVNALDKFCLETAELPILSFYLYLKAQLQMDITEKDKEIIQFITNHWSDSQANLFGEEMDIYTSNLTNYYACLQEIKNNFGYQQLQQTMTQIRDYLFDHMIKGGSLVGKQSTMAVTFDELLGVLPFGVFAPEDLIVVSAQEELVSKNSEEPMNLALLGIYFTEKFELEKSKLYLDKALNAPEKNFIACELIQLLQGYMAEKIGNQPVEFIHKPLGNGNVYETLFCERLPHYPLTHQYFDINVQVLGTENVPYLHIGEEVFEGQLVDEVQNIFRFTILSNASMNQENYYFSTETFKSENYILELSELWNVEKIEFLGSTSDSNVFQIVNSVAPLFLLMAENEFFLTQVEPAIENQKINTAWIYLDVETFALNYRNQEIHLVKEKPFVISGLLGQGISSFTMNYLDSEKASYFGFGERYNEINQTGNIIDCFVYNQYRDQGTKTYMPMPYFVTNQSYGIFVETENYTKFDLQNTKSGQVSITVIFEAGKPQFNFVLFTGTIKEMVGQFITKSGQPAMLPVWALGPWMSSNNWDRDSIVRREIEKTNDLQIPATVIVLEQWSDEATYYMWNDAQYSLIDPEESYSYDQVYFPEWGRWPNPKKLVEDCHKNGLKFILWQVPIEKYLNQQRHPLKDRDEAYMLKKGYAVKNEDGSPYRIPENWYTDSLLLDFTNEEAKKWWFNKRQYLLDIGVDGFKTDGGEMVFGQNVQFSNGKTGATMRNQYPNEYIHSYYQFAKQNKGITFSRSGYTGCQQFPAHWAGDERSTFDAFQRSLKAGINAGMSGVIFWGWDLGGFNGDIPTAELFIRSAQMATFCPIMQYHAESKGEFNQDRTPWNIAERTNNKEAISIYRKFANIRMNLLPYIYWQSKRSVINYQPLMKAMVLEYSVDDFLGTYDQYMFGENLLVAPIIKEGAVRRNVRLPEGQWVDFWTKEVKEGGQEIITEAAMDSIPVFIKENSVIPLNLGKEKNLGTFIGNDLENYQNMKLLVVAKSSFETEIDDYLGNTIHVIVEKKEESCVHVTGVDFEIEVELIEV
ncbi:MAG: glycosyl hydrolase [Lactobacillales bacterium]|jgi:alpha-glucosidase (family GH31 glycosyl hydrolase)|nr:glycosyl hydrolase [Lactobacillales bacterium]